MQANAQGREVVQGGGGGRRQNAQGSKDDQRAVETNNKAVIGADASGQPAGDLPQADQLMEIIRRNRDVRDLSGDGQDRKSVV